MPLPPPLGRPRLSYALRVATGLAVSDNSIRLEVISNGWSWSCSEGSRQEGADER